MKVIVCVDERLGMIFNKRRQSSDGAQIADMRELICGGTLSVSPYSAKLLANSGIKLDVTDSPHKCSDCCFIENTEMPPEDKIDTLVIYNWCRHYPADKRLTVDTSAFRLVEKCEFEGMAHSKITREIYVK